MSKFCSECGSALSQGARFCPACGTAVAAAAGEAVPPAAEIAAPPEVEPAPVAPAPVAPTPVVHDVVEAEGAAPAPHNNMILLGGAALLAVAIGGGAWLGLSSTDQSAETTTEQGAEPGEAAQEKLDYFAAADANLRDRPTIEGSKIVGSLKRGEKITGTLVGDERGKQWVKVDTTGQYVSLVNLSKSAPPSLATLDGSDRITTGRCSVLETPAAGAAVKTALQPGAKVRLIGATADGFTEFGLPGGGVGYAPTPDACATDPSPAKGAVANSLIKFDFRDCGFGPELEAYFKKAVDERVAKGLPDDVEEYIYPVDKVFQGLRVTNVIIGYEWQGVAFADPAGKAQKVFRKLGFEIDRDGNFPVPDDVAPSSSLQATNAESRARGQSELICGV